MFSLEIEFINDDIFEIYDFIEMEKSISWDHNILLRVKELSKELRRDILNTGNLELEVKIDGIEALLYYVENSIENKAYIFENINIKTYTPEEDI